MRALLAAAIFASSAAAAAATTGAEELTLARIYAAPDLNGPAPRALKLAPDGSRVTFLRAKASDPNQLDLWEYHIGSGRTRLLVDSALLAPKTELSAEEKARRERARIANFSGIVEYQFAPDGSALLFPLGGELYLYELARRGKDAVTRLTHGEGFATDPKLSPKGRYVAFVRGANLWVIERASGKQRQITRDGGGTIANGMAEFVADEEMDRHTGYWWAPDDSAIAFARYDESKVPVQKRFEIFADRVDVTEQRYPAAGDPNVAIALKVATIDAKLFASDAPAQIADVPLGPDPDIYLARVDWHPDGKRLAFQRQSRDQRTLELILADVASGAQRTLLTERASTWVNLNDDFRFLKTRDAFVWGSERSGLKQLYLYALDGTLEHPITRSDFDLDGLLGVDEKAGRVYVAAPGPDALEKHVFAYRLDGAGDPQRLTQEPGWHEAAFSRDARFFVDTYSNAETPPQVRLFEAGGARKAVLEPNALDAKHPYFKYLAGHRVPEFGAIAGPAGRLNYRLYKPSGFDPARRYPVLIRVYGGPGRQLANKGWGDWTDQYLARHGYIVFTLDNRGTPRRGKAFADAIHLRLGGVEVADQLAGVDWLRAQPFVDAERIGVFGWSYGGFMVLRMLEAASDRIAAGVAVAPVTDWALYDTHYTERYLSTPEKNAAGYAASGVFAELDRLKSPLLLIHGMADDNVLFVNSTRLMAALQSREIPFELMTYPGAKHSLVGPATRVHVYSAIEAFLDRQLKR
jgi:dipeptidyl-peptidase-4